jgi:hypothetical protein
MSDETLDEQVGALFPLDGPYNDDRTRAAGRSIAELVRYLNHAGWSDNAYPWPATVDSVLGSLGGAVAGLDQLLGQAERWFGDLCARDDAYTTGDGTPTGEAASAALYLGYARSFLANAQQQLTVAQRHTSRVGLDEQQAKRQRGEA